MQALTRSVKSVRSSAVTPFFLAAAVAASAVGCRSSAAADTPVVPAAPRLIERARGVMGSELQLTAWTGDERGALAAFDAVFAEFDRLENLMSVWRRGSEIVRLNAAAGRHPVAVSP